MATLTVAIGAPRSRLSRVPHVWHKQHPLNDTNSKLLRGQRAQSYARAIELQMLPNDEEHKRLYVIQLSDGSSSLDAVKLAFSTINLTSQFNDTADTPARSTMCYVLTTLCHIDIQRWLRIDRLQSLVKRGLLDFAIYDPETDFEIVLHCSGDTINRRMTNTRLLVIADDYLLDQCRHDAFKIEGDQLFVGRVTLSSSIQYEPNVYDSDWLSRVRSSWTWDTVPILSDVYSGALDAFSQVLSQVVKAHSPSIEPLYFFMPIGGLLCLSHLSKLSNEVALVAIDSTRLHTNIIPSKSMSFEPALLALKNYVQLQGGSTIHSTTSSMRLYLFGKPNSALHIFSSINIECAFDVALVEILTSIDALKQLRLPALLSLLESCKYEPEAFVLLQARLKAEAVVGGVTASILQRILVALQAVSDRNLMDCAYVQTSVEALRVCCAEQC